MNEWILQLIVGSIVATLAFFLRRHVASVDKKIDNLTLHSHETTKKVNTLETSINDVHRDMLVRFSEIKIPKTVDPVKVENINVNVAIVRNQLNNDVVPRLRRIEEDYGRIILVEDKVQTESKKLHTLYKTVHQYMLQKGIVKKKDPPE